MTQSVYKVKQTVELPIYAFDLTKEIDASSIVERCLSLKSNSPNERPDLVYRAWQSKYYNRENSPFSDLVSIVEEKVNLTSGMIHKVEDHWFVLYDHQGGQQWHAHGRDVASVYYANAGETAAPILFKDQDSTLTIPAKTGMLLTWPATLEHMVPEHTDGSQRIIVSMNLSMKWFNPYLPKP